MQLHRDSLLIHVDQLRISWRFFCGKIHTIWKEASDLILEWSVNPSDGNKEYDDMVQWFSSGSPSTVSLEGANERYLAWMSRAFRFSAYGESACLCKLGPCVPRVIFSKNTFIPSGFSSLLSATLLLHFVASSGEILRSFDQTDFQFTGKRSFIRWSEPGGKVRSKFYNKSLEISAYDSLYSKIIGIHWEFRHIVNVQNSKETSSCRCMLIGEMFCSPVRPEQDDYDLSSWWSCGCLLSKLSRYTSRLGFRQPEIAKPWHFDWMNASSQHSELIEIGHKLFIHKTVEFAKNFVSTRNVSRSVISE